MKGSSQEVTIASHRTSEEQWPGYSYPLEETGVVTSCELPTSSICLITKLYLESYSTLRGGVGMMTSDYMQGQTMFGKSFPKNA